MRFCSPCAVVVETEDVAEAVEDEEWLDEEDVVDAAEDDAVLDAALDVVVDVTTVDDATELEDVVVELEDFSVEAYNAAPAAITRITTITTTVTTLEIPRRCEPSVCI